MKNMTERNATIRNTIFSDLHLEDAGWERVNSRAYGRIMTDDDGNEVYARVQVTISNEREDATPQETMERDKRAYADAQTKKAERIALAEKKKAMREAMKAELDKLAQNAQ